jgi:hypothetical protein
MLIHSNIRGNDTPIAHPLSLSPLNERLKCKIVAIATVRLLTDLDNLDYTAKSPTLNHSL